MPFDLYSKRHKKQVDEIRYDLPEKLKNQVVYIWSNFFNSLDEFYVIQYWAKINSILCEEHGKRKLVEDGFVRISGKAEVQRYFELNTNIDECLDVVELIIRVILGIPQSPNHRGERFSYPPEKVIEDLNTRFVENGVGYEFIDDRIIRIENSLLHEEVIQPALNLLMDENFENANEEYLNAHTHYRDLRYKECLNECLKAFESTMKIICSKNNWQYQDKDTSKDLIKIILDNNLLPAYHTTQLTAIRTLFESSIPTIRNRNSGHGQGTTKIVVDEYLANYMLNITGATIKLLVEAYKRTSQN